MRRISTRQKTRAVLRRRQSRRAEKKDSAESRLASLGLDLPPAPKPMGVYQALVVVGKMAYASGHGPMQSDGTFLSGRVGSELDLSAGKDAARQTGLTILATLRRVLGNLDKVERV